MYLLFQKNTLCLYIYQNCCNLSTLVKQQSLKTQHIFKPGSTGRVYLQVIGSGAYGTPKSVYVFTDKKRYLFNCGEGTQRLAHEHKIKVSHLDDIFITTKTWDSFGGLPGISLTLQSAGLPKVNLHGPPGLGILYKAMNRFIAIEDMVINDLNCSPEKEYNDNIMSVKYVPMKPDKEYKNQVTEKSTSAVNNFHNLNNNGDVYYSSNKRKSTERRKDPENTVSDNYIDAIDGSDYSMAYICKFPKRSGVLDLEKCLEKGLTTGELLAKVRNMEDVVLEDGTLVPAHDVYTPDIPGPVFIVIDIPELSYLSESQFQSNFDTADTHRESIPAIVVHFTPSHVLEQERYQKFIQKFGPKTKHLLVNESNTCHGLLGVHRMQQKLHLLNNEVFPLLKDCAAPVARDCDNLESDGTLFEAEFFREITDKVAHAQIENIPENKQDTTLEGNIIQARCLTIFNLLTKQYLDRSQEIKLKVHEYIQEIMKVEGFSASMQEFYRKVEERKSAENTSPPKMYPKVVFLGTGSSVPGKTRNTSGIMLHIDENRVIMMDCGEGTYGQLVRFYGLRHANTILRNIKAIYISHLHADHHIGLISLLQARRKALDELQTRNPTDTISHVNLSNEQLYLLAPGPIMRWLLMYEQHFENITREFQLIPNSDMVQKRGEMVKGMPPAILSYLGLSAVQMCYVQHCPSAFGVAFTTQGNEKITYSGDTIPCDDLVNIGKDSTLLIHEATMEDNLARDARMKMHSTTSQAVRIGQRMQAKHTILTHFSQRYARLPVLSQDMLNGDSVGIAFDNMQVTLNDLELLPHMYAPLQLMFEEECHIMEVRTVKRERRQSWTRKLEGSR